MSVNHSDKLFVTHRLRHETLLPTITLTRIRSATHVIAGLNEFDVVLPPWHLAHNIVTDRRRDGQAELP